MRRAILCTALSVGSFAVTAAVLQANNQWSCWHWEKNVIGVSTAVGGYWGTIIGSEFNDWDSGTCVDFTGGNEITGDAGFYGATGWLGLARILDYDSGQCAILRAEALLNQSYMDGASYDETDDRHVACQEIGHTIGLDHRKGPKNQTCMNDQFLGWDFFDAHDAETVSTITVGCDSGGGGGGCAGGNEKGRKKCNDGIDNDGDGCIDADDPDCN
jgi:hypothetical protein